MAKSVLSRYWKKFWYFIWEDDSILSWAANVVLAFVLIKFIVYPSLGFLLATSHPVVAVMSSSMEHGGSFENWWTKDDAMCGERNPCKQAEFYELYNISKKQFESYWFHNGFNTGDIMIIYGSKPENIKIGDTVVYWGTEPIPIIHRVVAIYNENGQLYFRTKGDNNPGLNFNEVKIDSRLVIGKAVARVPYFGWVKIGFVRAVDKVLSVFS